MQLSKTQSPSLTTSTHIAIINYDGINPENENFIFNSSDPIIIEKALAESEEKVLDYLSSEKFKIEPHFIKILTIKDFILSLNEDEIDVYNSHFREIICL